MKKIIIALCLIILTLNSCRKDRLYDFSGNYTLHLNQAVHLYGNSTIPSITLQSVDDRRCSPNAFCGGPDVFNVTITINANQETQDLLFCLNCQPLELSKTIAIDHNQYIFTIKQIPEPIWISKQSTGKVEVRLTLK